MAVKSGIAYNQMREQAQIAFTTMLGSGQKARKFLDDLAAFAAKTPFEFQGLVESSQKLLAMGFAAEDVIPTMTAIGDAVAALGGDAGTLDRVTVALGQIKAKGKASAEEMLQLTEAGIPAWQMLADKIGKTVPEAMKAVSKGAIDADTTIKAVTEGMEKRFGGMMDKQSHTFQGLLSTIEDTASMVAGTITGPLFGVVEAGLQRIVDHLPEIQAAIERFVTRMTNANGWRAKAQVAADAFLAPFRKIDWRGLLAKGEDIAAGIKSQFEATDWSSVGETIGTGIADAVKRAIQNSKGLPSAFMESVNSIDWTKLGKAMGPGLAAAVVSAFVAITDPAFWIKNWDLALAVLLAVFSRGIGKIAFRLAAPLVRVMGDAVLLAAEAIERLSPRLASAFLAIMLRLPGLATRALRLLENVVARAFGRLGGIAKFTVKVLGIQGAIDTIVSFAQTVKGWIDKVVAWFKGLPGRIVAAVSGVDLSGIGLAIINSLWGGMKSAWEKVAGWLSGIGDKIKSIKGPKEKDAKLLIEQGRLIMFGLGEGMRLAQKDNERFLSGVAGSIKQRMNAAARDVSRLQAQMDAEARRREDRDNARALADAQKQLAEARKKGKGLADAERAVQDALERIKDTARQRELDKAQRNYDKLQAAFEKAQAKMEAAQEKANQRLQRLQDRAATAFDRLAAKIQRGFDARNDSFVAPAQQAIDAIIDRRSQEDLQSAADDAQKAYQEALLGGDKDEIARKLRDRDRALEDIKVAALEKDAARQSKAHDQEVAAQQDALDLALENLRSGLTEQGKAWDDGLSSILGVIDQYVGGFDAAGRSLGDAFAKSLRDAAFGSADASAAIASAKGHPSVAPAGGPAALGSTVVKNYNLNVGRIEQARPNETELYFRRMERLGL